jgi:filamentous hemagglutinin family protein
MRSNKNIFVLGADSNGNLSILVRLFVFLAGCAITAIPTVSNANAFPHSTTLAQITPDTTLGTEGSVVTPNVNIKGAAADQIDGGATRGSNLFHSFREFNIKDGQRVYFSNPAGINNILGRVTGNNLSNILGTLGVNGSANLFLINPNGIIFGQNASLDIGGSFIGSTANGIKFGDNTEFSAIAPQNEPLLTVSVPIGLQFGGNPGSIQVQGNGQGQRSTSELIDTTDGLRVQSNQTLALVGGNIALEGGTLKTAGGRIELGSVAGNGLVTLTPIDSGFALGYSGISTFGDIQLSAGAAVDASGAGGGNIQVQGRRVTLQDGSQIEASTLGAESGGTLNVNAVESIELIGATPDGESFSALNTLVYSGATGTGGNIIVETGQLIVQDAQIVTGTFGEGNAGDLTVSASESVELIKDFSGLFTLVTPGATGNGGNLSVETRRLIVRDGAQITTGTFGEGNAGDLTVSASESVEVIGTTANGNYATVLFAAVNPMATGNAGNLSIETGRLIVRDGAQIGTGTFGMGDGGDLTVLARESVEVLGNSPDDQFPSTLYTSVNPRAIGNGGNLSIETGRLIVRDGAQILANTSGKGNAGDLTVLARESVEVVGRTPDKQFFSGLFTSVNSGGIGNGGSLRVETGRLIVRDGSQITARMFGNGAAGNLIVSARSVELDKQAAITTIARTGNGGNISFKLQDLLLLRRNSQISSTSGITQQDGNGGNITINAPKGFIVASPNENSDITANSFQGSGGKVNINAAGIFGLKPLSRQELEPLLGTTDPTKLDPSQLQTSDITAISQTNSSLNGQVNLNTPDTDPSQGLEELPTDTVDVSGLINQNLCVASQGSEFIITGRGGLPPSPYDMISADTTWEDWWISPQSQTKPIPTINSSSPQKEKASLTIIEAQGWVKDANGDVTLTAKPVTVTAKGTWLHPQDCQMLRDNS